MNVTLAAPWHKYEPAAGYIRFVYVLPSKMERLLLHAKNLQMKSRPRGRHTVLGIVSWLTHHFRVLALASLVLPGCASGPAEPTSSPPVLYSEYLRATAPPAQSTRPERAGHTAAAVPPEQAETTAPTATLSAQKTDRPGVLELGDVLGAIWAEHPNIVRASAELEATGFDLAAAKTGYYPYFSITAREANNDASSTTLNIIQPLWSGGKTRAEVGEAQAAQNQALADLNRVRQELALEAVDAYLNVALGQEQLRLWHDYIASMEGLLSVISRRADAGVSPKVDIQTAQTRLSQARAGAASTRSVLQRNKSHLNSLLHRPISRLAWPSEEYRLSDDEIHSILGDGAIQAHPQGQAALAQLALQQARLRSAKASIFPDLSAQYRERLDQESGDFTPDSSFQFVLEFQSTKGLRGLRGYQAMKQRLASAEQELFFARRDVADQIATANAERLAALDQFDAQVAAADAATQLVESFLRQFKVGRKAWLEVLNAHREAHEAKLQVSAIKRNYWVANARLALHGMVWERLSETAPETYIFFNAE